MGGIRNMEKIGKLASDLVKSDPEYFAKLLVKAVRGGNAMMRLFNELTDVSLKDIKLDFDRVSEQSYINKIHELEQRVAIQDKQLSRAKELLRQVKDIKPIQTLSRQVKTLHSTVLKKDDQIRLLTDKLNDLENQLIIIKTNEGGVCGTPTKKRPKHNKPQLTDEQIARLYKDGRSTQFIADAARCNPNTIRNHLKKLKIWIDCPLGGQKKQ